MVHWHGPRSTAPLRNYTRTACPRHCKTPATGSATSFNRCTPLGVPFGELSADARLDHPADLVIRTSQKGGIVGRLADEEPFLIINERSHRPATAITLMTCCGWPRLAIQDHVTNT